MAEVSADLVCEVLKGLQRDVAQIKSEVSDIKLELNAIRGHQLSIQQDVHNIYGILGRYDTRFDRIERRVELSDTPSV